MDKALAAQVAHLEWEPLRDGWEIDLEEPKGRLPPGSNQISLMRDSQYAVIGELRGVEPRGADPEDEVVAGSLVPPLIIGGTDSIGRVYKLTEGYQDNYIRLGSVKIGGTRLRPFKARLSHFTAVRTHPAASELPTQWLTEWYLNGPDASGIFPHATQREVHWKYTRLRESGSFRDTQRPYGDGAYDHALIKYGKFTIIIHQVLKEFGPEWSHCLGIEYRAVRGTVPDRQQRVAIAEFVGFVLGRRLLNVGYTQYDKSGTPIIEMVTGPLTTSTVAMCMADTLPPIPINYRYDNGDIEAVLTKLLPAYIAQREDRAFEDAMWRYDLARFLPVGVDLPVIAAAVEGVANRWLSANKVKREYLDDEAFSERVSASIDKIESNLQDLSAEYRKIILNKMRRANGAGPNESPLIFFDHIGLKVGDFEKKAIQERNRLVHGGSAQPKDLDKAGKLAMAYRILFARMLLKLLGYDGTYFDYATLGCPSRDLNDPPVGIHK